MPARATADGIIRSEPIESHVRDGGKARAALPDALVEDGLPDTPEAGQDGDWSGWERWMAGHQNNLREELLDSVGDALGTLVGELEDKLAAQAKRINELELKAAQMAGTLDVLRGRGAPGSLNVKGTYCADESYAALDVVAFHGSSWVATRDRPGDLPGPGWQLLASAGRRGPRGERGPVGRGTDAPRWSSIWFDPKTLSFTTRLSDGSPGPSIRLDHLFAGVGVDSANYSIRLALNDGSELKFSLAGLFDQFAHDLRSSGR